MSQPPPTSLPEHPLFRPRALLPQPSWSRSAHASRVSSGKAESSMPWCRSPSLAKRAGTVAMVNSAWVDLVDLVPADRGGYGRLRYAAYRVGAGDGVVAGVLVERRKHGGVTVLAPPGGRDVVRRAAFDLAGEGVRGPPQLGKAPPRLDPDVDVQAITARGLGPPGRAELAEYLVHEAATRRTVANPHRGPGSRSMRHSSGRSTSARREFHGWNSTVDICTAHTTLASSVTHSWSTCRP